MGGANGAGPLVATLFNLRGNSSWRWDAPFMERGNGPLAYGFPIKSHVRNKGPTTNVVAPGGS